MSLTKKDLSQIEQILDTKLDEKLDEKLAKQTAELKMFAKEQTEELARMVQDTVVEPMDNHFNKLHERLETIEDQINPKIPFISWKKI